MRLFYFFSLLIIFSSCERERETPHVILTGYISEINADTITIRTDRQLKFHEQPMVSKALEINANNAFNDTLDLPEGLYEILVGNIQRKLFLKPGYDLQLKFENSQMTVTGKGQKENEYIKAREELSKEIGTHNFYQYYSQLPEKEFLKSTDSIENLSLQLLAEYKGIDSRLEAAEKNRAKVIKADKLDKYIFTHKRLADSNYTPSQNYPEALKELDLNNTMLLDVSLFPMLMISYSGSKAEKKDLERWEYILSEDYPVKNDTIIKEIFYLTGLYTMPTFRDIDRFHERARSVITDENKWIVIDKKYQELTRLEKGREAPKFVLKNMQGEMVSLDDLKGNVVYLDFWASWCRPCIDEMPSFKRLQEEFNSRDIKFVSIGIESKKESLKKLLKKYGLEGIQLYDPEKEKELQKKYGVEGIPHYVLIDREGKMIEQRAKRPSDPALESQLKELLN